MLQRVNFQGLRCVTHTLWLRELLISQIWQFFRLSPKLVKKTFWKHYGNVSFVTVHSTINLESALFISISYEICFPFKHLNLWVVLQSGFTIAFRKNYRHAGCHWDSYRNYGNLVFPLTPTHVYHKTKQTMPKRHVRRTKNQTRQSFLNILTWICWHSYTYLFKVYLQQHIIIKWMKPSTDIASKSTDVRTL